MSDDEAGYIVCATYTHARRHPMVLGNIAGWTPPFQLSMPQLAVLGVTAWLEFQTWPYWGAHLPRNIGLLIAIGGPCLLAWAVRRARFEGRSLIRTAVGLGTWLASSFTARTSGRPYRPAPARSLRPYRVFVASAAAFRPAERPSVVPALAEGAADERGRQ